MIEIDRICFVSLNRDKKYNHHYIVLLDGWFNDELWADNDEEAIKDFRNQYGNESVVA